MAFELRFLDGGEIEINYVTQGGGPAETAVDGLLGELEGNDLRVTVAGATDCANPDPLMVAGGSASRTPLHNVRVEARPPPSDKSNRQGRVLALRAAGRTNLIDLTCLAPLRVRHGARFQDDALTAPLPAT